MVCIKNSKLTTTNNTTHSLHGVIVFIGILDHAGLEAFGFIPQVASAFRVHHQTVFGALLPQPFDELPEVLAVNTRSAAEVPVVADGVC
jgi:hypothetical protein